MSLLKDLLMPLANLKPIEELRTRAIDRINVLTQDKLDIIAPMRKQLSALQVKNKHSGKNPNTLPSIEQVKLEKANTILAKVESVVDMSNEKTSLIAACSDVGTIRQIVEDFITFLGTIE